MNKEVAATQTPRPPAETHMSLRLRLPLISFFLMLAAAIFLPDRVWNTLLVGLGGMFLVAYVWVRLLARDLQASRQLQARWVAVGDNLEEIFTVYNGSQAPALWVEVSDRSNVPGYQAAVVRSPGVARVDRWRQSALCLQRGQYTIGPWSIRTGDPFGIFMLIIRYHDQQEIIIHPPIASNIPITLPAGQSSGRKRARQRSWHARINAATVRQYVPGDPLRWIHWPTSARRDELFVRLFDLDAAGDIWILLDMQAGAQLGEGMSGTEEHAVLLAASLAARALRQNRPVGVAGYGELPQVVDTGQGQGQEWRILRALALMRADGQVALGNAMRDLARLANRNSAIIIITPNPDMAWISELIHLAQQGLESTVILLERHSFGGNGPTEAQRTAVQRLDLNCQIVRQGELGVPSAEELAERKRRVTPLGRVVGPD